MAPFAYEPVIVLAPLFGAAIAGLFQKQLGEKLAMAVATLSVGISLVLGYYTFAQFTWGHAPERVIELFRFVDVAGFRSVWSVRIDALSSVMLVVVTTV